jgi:hypothetical protein
MKSVQTIVFRFYCADSAKTPAVTRCKVLSGDFGRHIPEPGLAVLYSSDSWEQVLIVAGSTGCGLRVLS